MSADTSAMAGQAIRHARTEARLSQAALAGAIGVRQQTVAKWETGENRPTVDNVVAMAGVMDALDPLQLVFTYWPEVAAADPVPPELRSIVAEADERELRALVKEARRIVRRDRVRESRVVRIRQTDSDGLPRAASDGSTRRGATARRPSPPAEDTPEV